MRERGRCGGPAGAGGRGRYSRRTARGRAAVGPRAWSLRPNGPEPTRVSAPRPRSMGGAVLENEALRVVIGPQWHADLDPRQGRGPRGAEARSDGQQAGTVRGSPCQLGCLGHSTSFFEDRGEVVGGLTRIEIVEDRPIARRGRDRTRLSPEPADAARGIAPRLDAAGFRHGRSTGTNSIFCSRPPYPVDIRAARADFEHPVGADRPPDPPQHQLGRGPVRGARAEMGRSQRGQLRRRAAETNCKYGYDVRGDVLRLSLIKSATMPDSGADQGHHRFTYALLPHGGRTHA